MPIYEYECPSGHITEGFHSMASYPASCCCGSCDAQANIIISKRQYINTFKPYVDENFNGEPIEITSFRQRDELCKKHSLTYDSSRYVRKPKPKSAVEDVTLDQVKKAVEDGRTPDGLPIRPVVKAKAKSIN